LVVWLALCGVGIGLTACSHVGSLESDGGIDSDADTDGDTDTDPTDDYDCEDPTSSPCAQIVCAALDQYEELVAECADGDEFACLVIEVCFQPFWLCVDEQCAGGPTPEDPEELIHCATALTLCTGGLI